MAAGTLLSMFSRLWTTFLQLNGFTCGIGDLLLQPGAEGQRAAMVAQAERRALSASAEYVGLRTEDIADLNDSSVRPSCPEGHLHATSKLTSLKWHLLGRQWRSYALLLLRPAVAHAR